MLPPNRKSLPAVYSLQYRTSCQQYAFMLERFCFCSAILVVILCHSVHLRRPCTYFPCMPPPTFLEVTGFYRVCSDLFCAASLCCSVHIAAFGWVTCVPACSFRLSILVTTVAVSPSRQPFMYSFTFTFVVTHHSPCNALRERGLKVAIGPCDFAAFRERDFSCLPWHYCHLKIPRSWE